MQYDFTLGKHTTQAHKYIDELIDEAYRQRPGPQERVQKAGALCEAHYEQIGRYPDSSVLNRLAWYIVIDDMIDRHPDKMTREEYPILSDWQTKIRKERDIPLANVYTGKNDITIGRKRDHGGVKRRIYDYMTPERDKGLIPPIYLDLYDAIENAGLTERQRQAIELIYFEGLTQEVAAEVMGVSARAVRYFLADAITKIRRKFIESTS